MSADLTEQAKALCVCEGNCYRPEQDCMVGAYIPCSYTQAARACLRVEYGLPPSEKCVEAAYRAHNRVESLGLGYIEAMRAALLAFQAARREEIQPKGDTP